MLELYISSIRKNDGKTFVAAGLSATMQSLGYKTSVYRPIQTEGLEINGFTQSPDLTYIKSVDPYINTSFSYLYKENGEVLIASEAENNYVDINQIKKDYKKLYLNSDCIITEADGGLLNPITVNFQNADLIKELALPVLFVLAPGENIVNDTLLNIDTALNKGLNVRGVVINNIEEDYDKRKLTSITRLIEEYSGVKILGLCSHIEGKLSPEELITNVLNGIDIESVFQVKIEKLEFC